MLDVHEWSIIAQAPCSIHPTSVALSVPSHVRCGSFPHAVGFPVSVTANKKTSRKSALLEVAGVSNAQQAVWDALKPRSCDTHSTSYSATRETFLKLLRPGVDYREAFHKVTRRGTDAARDLGAARAGILQYLVRVDICPSADRTLKDTVCSALPFFCVARGRRSPIPRGEDERRLTGKLPTLVSVIDRHEVRRTRNTLYLSVVNACQLLL